MECLYSAEDTLSSTPRWKGDSSSVMVTHSGQLARQHTHTLANLYTYRLEITHLAVPYAQPRLRGHWEELEGLPRIIKYLRQEDTSGGL